VVDRRKMGFIDKNGRVVIAPRFAKHLARERGPPPHFSGGLARVDIPSQCGFIDKSGKIDIPPQFDLAD
jgi:hypothetical protein